MWLKRLLRDWLLGDDRNEMQSSRPGRYADTCVLLNSLVSSDNPTALSVVRIENGFLVARRRHNPTGPDHVDATYAATPEDLTAVLVSNMVHTRLTTTTAR
ncbi:hypothetical protein V6O07_12055 [Arthrospira platensis SPKY2]